MRRLILIVLIFATACTSQQTASTSPDVFGNSTHSERNEEAIALAQEQTVSWLNDPANNTMDGVDAVEILQTDFDSLGMAHIRLDQIEEDVPVFGAQLIVHLFADGEFSSLTDGLVRSIEVDTTPSLSADQAIDIAIEANPGASVSHQADLFVLRHDGLDHLVYRTRVEGFQLSEPSKPVVFVDAHSGEVVWTYDNMHTLLDRETHKFIGDEPDYDLPGQLIRSEGQGDSGDAQVDDAHNFMGEVYDYFWEEQQRDGYDDNGKTIVSTVRWWETGVNESYYHPSWKDNAFWSGPAAEPGDHEGFVFGSGYTKFEPLAGASDVVHHEFTHAVTDYSVFTRRVKGLVYAGESGALNEATSDIFAAVVDARSAGWSISGDTWRMGEDVGTSDLGANQVAAGGLANVIDNRPALRYMNNPPADGKSIDHYSDYRATLNVHYSSGIANKAFYLMVQDSSLTISGAADIWYRALTQYMVPRTRFIMARTATIQTATDLFGPGSPQTIAVADAWTEVGVPLADAKCEPAASLQGWTEVTGDNGDMDIATDNIDSWPSSIAVGNFEGPEVAYYWTAPITGTAKIKLVRPRPTQVNHDIFLLLDPADDGSCNSHNAAKRGHNDLTFEVRAGQHYFVVIDGFNGDVGPFTLRFEED